MIYKSSLQQGRLISRYKRFMADIERPDGSQITLHCPNTGSMKNCLYPGQRVWYSDSGNGKRKYPCTWEQAEIPVLFNGETRLTRAGINTQKANLLVEELLNQKKVPELASYRVLKKEVRYGQENSRIDFLLQDRDLPDCYMEVKSVTLAEGDGLGLFPDAVTVRGRKHLRELMAIRKEGYRAILFFCVQHTGIERVAPAKAIDPGYAHTLQEAVKAGVELLAWQCDITSESIHLSRPLPVTL